MSEGKRHPPSYARFLLLAVGTLLLLIALGWVPTLRLGGEKATHALLAGCAVSFVASAASALLVRTANRLADEALRDHVVAAAMGSMAIRLLVVLVLATSLVLSDWFERVPLLLWVAISHGGLLVADTKYSLQVLVRTELSEKIDEP